MKIWLCYRLYDYAVAQRYDIVGEPFDDNISGMHFNRAGIDKSCWRGM